MSWGTLARLAVASFVVQSVTADGNRQSPTSGIAEKASSAVAEHLAEQVGDARRGVGADLLFLVADHVEEAVEGAADDVVVEVEGLEVQEGNVLGAAEQILVLLGDADLAHRALHDR